MAYSDKAIMKVHSHKPSSNFRIPDKHLSDLILYNELSHATRVAVKPNLKLRMSILRHQKYGKKDSYKSEFIHWIHFLSSKAVT